MDWRLPVFGSLAPAAKRNQRGTSSDFQPSRVAPSCNFNEAAGAAPGRSETETSFSQASKCGRISSGVTPSTANSLRQDSRMSGGVRW